MMIFGPLGIVSMVLVVAGTWKLRSPAPVRTAMGKLRLRVPSFVVRLLGLAEIALGILAVTIGGVVFPALVGGAYLVFAAISWSLRGTDVSCGCFGAVSTAPPGPLHLGVNLVSAAVALTAALVDVPGITQVWDDLPGAGVPHVLLVAIGTLAVVGVLTVLPDARAEVDGAFRVPRPVAFGRTRRAG